MENETEMTSNNVLNLCMTNPTEDANVQDVERITYGIVEERYLLDEDERTAYGIAICANANLDGIATVLEIINDITSDRERIFDFVKKCNDLELSPLHIYDAIEDFLAG